MNVGRVLGRLAARAAAAGLAIGYVGLAVAADEPVRVTPPVASEPCPTCTACTAGEAGPPCGQPGCSTCGKAGHRAGCNPKKPVVGQLRPGACFGYFQTQWHRWEDVCPLPYQGVGQTDAPKSLPTAAPGAVGIPGAIPKSDGPAPKSNPMPMLPAPMPKGTTGTVPMNPVLLPAPESKFGK